MVFFRVDHVLLLDEPWSPDYVEGGCHRVWPAPLDIGEVELLKAKLPAASHDQLEVPTAAVRIPGCSAAWAWPCQIFVRT